MEDSNHGQGGSYVIRDGKRVLVEDSRTKPHDEGGARDNKGKLLDAGPAKGATPEPALPAPQPAAWLKPASSSEASTATEQAPAGKTDKKGA